jgi:hypothetical protein
VDCCIVYESQGEPYVKGCGFQEVYMYSAIELHLTRNPSALLPQYAILVSEKYWTADKLVSYPTLSLRETRVD